LQRCLFFSLYSDAGAEPESFKKHAREYPFFYFPLNSRPSVIPGQRLAELHLAAMAEKAQPGAEEHIELLPEEKHGNGHGRGGVKQVCDRIIDQQPEQADDGQQQRQYEEAAKVAVREPQSGESQAMRPFFPFLHSQNAAVIEEKGPEQQRKITESHLDDSKPIGDVIAGVFAPEESAHQVGQGGEQKEQGQQRQAADKEKNEAAEIAAAGVPEFARPVGMIASHELERAAGEKKHHQRKEKGCHHQQGKEGAQSAAAVAKKFDEKSDIHKAAEAFGGEGSAGIAVDNPGRRQGHYGGENQSAEIIEKPEPLEREQAGQGGTECGCYHR